MAKKFTFSSDPELIQRYLTGKMPEDEQAAFEKEVDDNPQLREAVVDASLATWAVQAYGKQEEKAQLDALFQENSRQAKVIDRMHYRWMAVAAVIALLFVSYFLFRPASSLTYEQVIAQHYELPQIPELMDTQSVDLIRKADQAYEAEKWEDAIFQYKEVLTDSLAAFPSSRISLYLGISYLQIQDWAQAEQALQGAVQHPEQRDWYLILAQLKKRDKEAARSGLEKIVQSPSHFYSAKAKKLLEDLERVE